MNPSEIKTAKDFLRIAKEFEANATIDRETVVVIPDYINQLEAEVERLKAEQEMTDGYAEALEERAKSEAIKEFAQRLKSNFAVIKYISLVLYERIIQIIDNLVKEMVGDANG